MALIGAALVAAGTLLLASLWLSKGGATAASSRDPMYKRDRTDRPDATEPLRRS